MTCADTFPQLVPKDRVQYCQQWIDRLPRDYRGWARQQTGTVVDTVDPAGMMVWVRWDMYPEHPRSLAFARHLEKVA